MNESNKIIHQKPFFTRLYLIKQLLFIVRIINHHFMQFLVGYLCHDDDEIKDIRGLYEFHKM